MALGSLSRDALRPPGLPAERVAACLGLVSDTHMPERLAALPPALFDALRGVDLLLHAGDIGELRVLDHLSAIAPVVAVHGNDDTPDAQRELPYSQLVAVAGQRAARLLLTHAHYPDRAEELASRRDDAWGPKVDRRATLARSAGATIAVFGHTHIPMATWHAGVLLINPGALAPPNWVSRQLRQTVALLYIRDDGVPFVVHVDLASPDRPFAPEIAWAAGFRAAHARFTASILDADLAAGWEGLSARMQELPPESYKAAILRAAHRVWAGERPALTRADLLAELRAEQAIVPESRARIAESDASEQAQDGDGIP